MTVPAWLARIARRASLWALVTLAFVTPFAVSLAANVTAGMHTGSSVLLVAGIAIPVMLMIAIELYLWVLDRHGDVPLLGKVAMGAPVVVAAGWSWLDTTSLLLTQYQDPWWLQRTLCVAAPLATDGLAVLAVFVRRLIAQTTRVVATAPVEPVTHDEPAAVSDDEVAQWGGPDTVIPETEPEPQPTPLHSLPPRKPSRRRANGRTRDELVTAGKALTPNVIRKTHETVDQFRKRIEAAERAARRDVTDRIGVPA